MRYRLCDILACKDSTSFLSVYFFPLKIFAGHKVWCLCLGLQHASSWQTESTELCLQQCSILDSVLILIEILETGNINASNNY